MTAADHGRLGFGVLQFFSWPGRRVPPEAVYSRALERIDLMERSGVYDAVWLAEHHFTTYSVSPSVSMMGTMVAARTERLRIGTAVSLAAMQHPLRLAEEIALLDVLSGGRVNWGAGRGNDPTEFRVFGLDLDRSYALFRENVEVVLQAWRQERLTHRGRFHTFEDIEVLPKPLQRPHPPVWMAASSPEAVAWAASAGYSILMDPHSSHAAIGVKYRAYRQGLADAGHPVDGRVIPMARLIAVAPTDEEARRIALRGTRWTLGSLSDPSRRDYSRSIRPAGDRGARHDGRDRAEAYADDVVIHGSPARVAERIKALQEEIGLHYLLCAPLSHESFLLLTREVIPKLL
ncbi:MULTISPECIES: LLM class flavin-dependent oxidoreductase [unclassified Streptomyces]|uniref:LLM class flavin-dependent oxidoreductase n=1 Tax=unclassified Streptomyces TaxID=2593676 RepID=UPI0033D81C49